MCNQSNAKISILMSLFLYYINILAIFIFVFLCIFKAACLSKTHQFDRHCAVWAQAPTVCANAAVNPKGFHNFVHSHLCYGNWP